jgi:hypothetical protein
LPNPALSRDDYRTFPCWFGELASGRRAMDEQVDRIEQVVEELPEYALMIDLPD